MQDQLQKSKMAAQNITTFKINQQQFKKQINQIQNDLHNCILKINNQTKKQKILIQLISLLKGQNYKYQTKQKHQQQIINSFNQKKIKKIQYDIQQILQKYNQEIAKINLLKQQTNCCRSQRVVYSNLFKKLEKQIKYYQQNYQQYLLKTQITQLKKLENSNNFQTNISRIQQKQHQQNMNNTLNINSQIYPQSNVSGSQPAFITNFNNDAIDIKPISKKIILPNENKNDGKSITKTISNKINQYQRQISKIKIYAGCDSIGQLLDHYGKIQQENQQLVKMIQTVNSNIETIKIMKDKHINQQKTRKSAITILLPQNSIGQNKQQQNIKQLKANIKRQQKQKLLKIIEQLLKIFNINLNDQKISYQIYSQIDWKIDCIRQLSNKQNKKQQTLLSDTFVQCLLERMDKFYDCQKIMDKQSFKQQYKRQINKGKRINKSKKT